MKTKLTTLLMVLMLTQVSAQSNWITENFKTHLTDDKVVEYVDKGNKLLSEMVDAEKSGSEYVMELFEMTTGSDNAKMPICYFDDALELVNLALHSEEISRAVYLAHYNVGDFYYYFLYNTLGNVGIEVSLSELNEELSENEDSKILALGAEAYSVTFIGASEGMTDYELQSFNMVAPKAKSPCLD